MWTCVKHDHPENLGEKNISLFFFYYFNYRIWGRHPIRSAIIVAFAHRFAPFFQPGQRIRLDAAFRAIIDRTPSHRENCQRKKHLEVGTSTTKWKRKDQQHSNHRMKATCFLGKTMVKPWLSFFSYDKQKFYLFFFFFKKKKVLPGVFFYVLQQPALKDEAKLFGLHAIWGDRKGPRC